MKKQCNELKVPRKTCYINLGRTKKTKYSHSSEDFETIKGDMLWLDFDKKNKVIGIDSRRRKTVPNTHRHKKHTEAKK